AVRRGVALDEQNIAENVGTAASTRERAERWIQENAENKGTNKGFFGHACIVDFTLTAGELGDLFANENGVVVDRDKSVDVRAADEIQGGSFQKKNAEELVIESYVNKFLDGKLAKTNPMYEKTEDLNNVREQIRNAPSK